MNDFQLLPVGGELYYTPDFSADVPEDVTVSAIAFTVEPSASPMLLALSAQSDDLANCRSSIRVTGARHGYNYVLKATAALSNGEDLIKSISIIGFNG